MTQPSRVARVGPARPEEQGADETVDGSTAVDRSTAAVDSTVLMDGRRELLIRHGEETYRLRVTASNKLILTK